MDGYDVSLVHRAGAGGYPLDRLRRLIPVPQWPFAAFALVSAVLVLLCRFGPSVYWRLLSLELLKSLGTHPAGAFFVIVPVLRCADFASGLRLVLPHRAQWQGRSDGPAPGPRSRGSALPWRTR